MVAVQPTRGLDVGAIETVHRLLLERRDKGAGILLISEDLDEILALADRIDVMYEGRIVGSFDAATADVHEIGLLMTGGGADEDAAAAADEGPEGVDLGPVAGPAAGSDPEPDPGPDPGPEPS